MMRWLRALTVLAAASPPAAACAQTYPAKPIKLIVSTSAGGITDIAARILGAHITARTGQPVVIDNRAGASGNIAMDAVAKAAPDGLTLGVANTGNIVINPYLMRHMLYDPLNDLVPVGVIGMVPLFLVMNAGVPATTVQEFIAYAKAQPDKVSYASAGVGTTPDLAAHEFNRFGLEARVRAVPRHRTGGRRRARRRRAGDVRVDGAAYRVRASGQAAHPGRRHAQARALCAGRAHLRRAGISRLRDADLVRAVRAARTPAEIVDQLNGYARARPGRRRQEAAGSQFIDPATLTAPEFAALVKADAGKWERIVRDAGVRID